ncbi:hypothetical protein FSP39_005326 [Pinctada imbricata]|uniref:Uncharacterized protein n=1 Tax=Pinctada imbricata TaxID=66713 RepID=A0AA88XCS6_PINIB|nr:hypothetical protein FSP39_005326 [Pinctada imbricata]
MTSQYTYLNGRLTPTTGLPRQNPYGYYQKYRYGSGYLYKPVGSRNSSYSTVQNGFSYVSSNAYSTDLRTSRSVPNIYSTARNDYAGNDYSTVEYAYNTDQNVYSTGVNACSTDQNVYSTGVNAYSTDQNVYSTGVNAYSTDQNVYSTGVNAYSTDQNAFSTGMNAYSADQNVYNTGVNAYSADQNVYITDVNAYGTDQNNYNADAYAYNAGQSADMYSSDQNTTRMDAYSTVQNSYDSEYCDRTNDYSSAQNYAYPTSNDGIPYSHGNNVGSNYDYGK